MPKQKRTIPEIGLRLKQLARELRCGELRVLADELRREKPVRKAAITSVKLTPYIVRRVKQYAERDPAAPFSEIASFYSINPGRVSEILNGKHDHMLTPPNPPPPPGRGRLS